MPLFGIVALSALLLASPAPQTNAYKLTGVQVKGAQRYTSEEVASAGGLTTGQPVTLADVKSAAERLANSGLFKSLTYRYVTKADAITVIFEFEEADWTVPVLFDNFVWLSDAEVTAAVRRDVPSFDGTAPATEGATDLIVRSLTALLKARNIAGQVQYTPETDLKGTLLQHVFSVRSPGPRTCAVRFDGTSAVSEQELEQSIHESADGDYSRFRMRNLAKGTLTDVYRRRGFWRATLAEPAVTPEKSASCSGVIVRFAVTEGRAYAFDHVEWSGTSALSADKLDTLFAMKSGDIANVMKIDDGIRQVKRAYGDIGHVLVAVKYAPKLDDGTLRATVATEVEEGPQFRMGTFDVTGVSDADAADLRAKWHLRSGDVFNASYPMKYRFDEIKDLLRRGSLAPKKVSIDSRLDPDTKVVHIRLAFE